MESRATGGARGLTRALAVPSGRQTSSEAAVLPSLPSRISLSISPF
jgi:hypothetical protein